MLIKIYKNEKEYLIEPEKADEYCHKYGFTKLPIKKRKKKEVNNDNNAG